MSTPQYSLRVAADPKLNANPPAPASVGGAPQPAPPGPAPIDLKSQREAASTTTVATASTNTSSSTGIFKIMGRSINVNDLSLADVGEELKNIEELRDKLFAESEKLTAEETAINTKLNKLKAHYCPLLHYNNLGLTVLNESDPSYIKAKHKLGDYQKKLIQLQSQMKTLLDKHPILLDDKALDFGKKLDLYEELKQHAFLISEISATERDVDELRKYLNEIENSRKSIAEIAAKRVAINKQGDPLLDFEMALENREKSLESSSKPGKPGKPGS